MLVVPLFKVLAPAYAIKMFFVFGWWLLAVIRDNLEKCD